MPYCEQAIVLDQNYSEAYYRKGIILSKIGDYDNALESFKKAQRYGFDFEEVEKKLKETENSLKRSQK
ncbi:MAG: tetratricopeptide repeat protein [Acidobacteria bacterium]|nr:tetratricopeptide repeat protein [Acidobacteriota bacterium]